MKGYKYFIEYGYPESDYVTNLIANGYEGYYGKDWDYEWEEGSLIVYTNDLRLEEDLEFYEKVYAIRSGKL